MQYETFGSWSFTGCGWSSSGLGGGAAPAMLLEPGEFQSSQNPTKQKEEEEEEKAQTSNTSWEEEKSPTDKNVVLWW